ncbi:MAG: DUF4446 family protein [bacterium]|nr:DUF4446 family protein [bacterium]
MITQLQIIFFVLFSLISIFGIFWIYSTEKRLKRFFLGKKAKDLEDTIIILENEMRKLNESKIQTEKELKDIHNKLRQSIRGLETIRFNPFPDQGSNQSFAISLLNEENDGVIISSLYSRDRMSIFAKPIKKGTSTYELTEEEKEVLMKAKVN